MKKEVKLRKKRFFAFLLAMILVCGSGMPTRIVALDHSNIENSLIEGDTVMPEDTITASEGDQSCLIVYIDYDGVYLDETEIGPNADEQSHTVKNYTDFEKTVLPSEAFGGWKVSTVDVFGGYINSIQLRAERNDMRYEDGVLYIDAIYSDEELKEIELSTYLPDGYAEAGDIDRRVYSAEVMQEFTSTFTYAGNSYESPDVELIVDSSGAYHVDGADLTIYAVPFDSCFTLDDEYFEMRYTISGSYYMDDGNYYEQVVFAPDAIQYSNGDGQAYELLDITVNNYEPARSSYAVGEYVIYADDMNIFNKSGTPVMVEGTATLWVGWDLTGESVINLSYEGDTLIDNEYYGGSFAKSGETVTISPEEGNSLTGIDLSQSKAVEEVDVEWQEEYIEHRTDGTKVITIPKVSVALYVDSKEKLEFDINLTNPDGGNEYLDYVSYQGMILDLEEDSWHIEEFTFSAQADEDFIEVDGGTFEKTIYKICELTEETGEDQFVSELTIDKEGRDVEKTYVILDLSLEASDGDGDGVMDSIYHGENYGEIILLHDIYNLDLNSPVINADTGVTLTAEDGSSMELKGIWQPVEEKTMPEVKWINYLPVTLTVNTEDDGLLPTTKYQIKLSGEENETFAEVNTRNFTENGYYELYISAQDGRDELMESGVENRWVSVLGIDTTTPIIYYGDDTTDGIVAELIGSQSYEGNLRLQIVDRESGVATITAYEAQSGVWTESKDILVSTDTLGEMYMISPIEEDKTYRITVTDQAGNTVTYDNIMVLGKPVEEEAPDTEEAILIENSGTVAVKAGTAYVLGEGSWKIEGDPTSYGGETTFYVSEDSEYNFVKE